MVGSTSVEVRPMKTVRVKSEEYLIEWFKVERLKR